MKAVKQWLLSFGLLMMGSIFFSSCDPCSGVVCNNGTCGNGICICADGYDKQGTSCEPVNKRYVGSGMITATVTTVNSNGNSTTNNNVGYTLEASETDPFMFTIKNFNSLLKNDVTFTINSTNYDVLGAETVTTAAGNSYEISGSKVGSQIQMTLKNVSTNFTYSIAYTI